MAEPLRGLVTSVRLRLRGVALVGVLVPAVGVGCNNDSEPTRFVPANPASSSADPATADRSQVAPSRNIKMH